MAKSQLMASAKSGERNGVMKMAGENGENNGNESVIAINESENVSISNIRNGVIMKIIKLKANININGVTNINNEENENDERKKQ